MVGHVQEGTAQMCRAIALDHAGNVGIFVTGALGCLAEAKAIAGLPEEGLATLGEALARVNKTDERYWEAELDRLQAQLPGLRVFPRLATADNPTDVLKALEAGKGFPDADPERIGMWWHYGQRYRTAGEGPLHPIL